MAKIGGNLPTSLPELFKSGGAKKTEDNQKIRGYFPPPNSPLLGGQINQSAFFDLCSTANSREHFFGVLKKSGSNILVFLWFDLENFGLERSGRLVGRFPPIFVKNAPEDSEL